MDRAIEERIRQLYETEDLEGAATVALEYYGGEILGFLVATMGSQQDAEEVFSQVCEDTWRGIGGFSWRCSFRTWLYTIARHAAARFLRSPHRPPDRHLSLSAAAQVADNVRSQTRPYLRTEVKDRFAELRAHLAPEDQMLLVLRVDRKLSWNDVARVMMECVEDDDEQLKRHSACLRKRFQSVKETLRRRASEEGLM